MIGYWEATEHDHSLLLLPAASGIRQSLCYGVCVIMKCIHACH